MQLKCMLAGGVDVCVFAKMLFGWNAEVLVTQCGVYFSVSF